MSVKVRQARSNKRGDGGNFGKYTGKESMLLTDFLHACGGAFFTAALLRGCIIYFSRGSYLHFDVLISSIGMDATGTIIWMSDEDKDRYRWIEQ